MTKAFTTLLLTLNCLFLHAQDFSWEQKTSMPEGRFGALTFVIADKAYVVGGRIGSLDDGRMWCYDPVLDNWQEKAPIPVARRLGGVFAINGKGYVTCGLVGTSTRLNDLWEYDPISDSWTERAIPPGPGRDGPYSFEANGLGYLGTGNIGSSSGPFLDDAWVYDPTTDTWTTAPPIPDLARFGTSYFSHNGKGYVFGGKESNQSFTPDLWEFDPVVGTWTLLAPFPGAPRSSPMAFIFQNFFVIGCGRNNTTNFFDVWQYRRSTNEWSISLQYPGESSLAGTSFSINGRAFGGLGWLLTDNSSRADLWELIKPDDVGISELVDHGSVTVFPDPVSQHGDIWINHTFGPGTTVEVFDPTGKHIGSWAAPSGTTLPWANRSPGVHLLRFQNDNSSSTVKLIVEPSDQ